MVKGDEKEREVRLQVQSRGEELSGNLHQLSLLAEAMAG